MNGKVANATKWSVITEIVAKLISPITNMILARLLVPDMFGVVTSITMIISFADLFSDAGFQKYLVQHEFESKDKLKSASDVAFTANLIISISLWVLISLFSEPLARMLGNQGKGIVLIVACASLPLTSFSSIQMALFKREFEFKRLFYARIIGTLVPLVVTVPLAAIFRNYWSLVIGTICGNLVNAISLTFMSNWKPRIRVNFAELKAMLSFSLWALVESLITWLTTYVDVFILGLSFSSYYLGLYKTSMTTISQIMAIITGSTNAVLFSALSREQDNQKAFLGTFYKFQHLVSIIVIPMGVGVYAYREFVTLLLLGSQWAEAADFIGLWGFVSGFYIVLGGYCSELYRAKGKPNVSAFAQLIYTVIIFITINISKDISFEATYISRTTNRIIFIMIHFIISKVLFSVSILKVMKNIFPATIASAIMLVVAMWLKSFSGDILWSLISVLICIAVYLVVIMIMPGSRNEIVNYINTTKRK